MSFTAPVMYKQEEEETRKGPWTVEEDRLLINYVALHGEGRWNILAKAAGLKRCGKSCRLRWVNYLRPDLKRGNITPDEERLIIDLQNRWGNRWSRIAQRLPGRTDNEIKNYWRTRLKRKLHKANAGNRYSSPYLFHYNSMPPHSFLQQNSRSAEENTAAVQNILQQSGTLCNNPVLHFDEKEKERFVLCPFDSIRILNGVNSFEENNGVVEDLSMPYEMESFAAMVSELYEDVLEDGGRSQFMEY